MNDIDIGSDLLLLDQVQTVTLTLMRTTNVVIEINHANKGVLSKDQDSQFNSEGNGLQWIIPNVELNAGNNDYEIRPQDELNDGVFNQVVVSAKCDALGGKWVVITNRKK